MANPYYSHGGAPAQGSAGVSASMRAEFDLLVAAFDMLPSLSGNANKVVVVNAGATGLTLTSGTLALAGNLATTGAFNTTLAQTATTTLTLPALSGTLATLAGTEEFTNKTLTSAVGKGTWTASGTWTLPAHTLGGTVSGGGQQLNNIIIGTSTPLAGSFTTITGTSAVIDIAAGNKSGITIGTGSSTQMGWIAGNSQSGVAGLWASNVSPSTSNYSLAADNTANLYVNAQSGGTLRLSVGNSTISDFTSTGQALTGTLGVSGNFAVATNKFNVTASTGATAIAGTLSPASLVDISGTAAGQIKFPATQNASSNANTLDDYVEGSFVLTLTGCTTSPTVTVQYTKTGNQVTLNFPFSTSAMLSATSNSTSKGFTGLPAALTPAQGKRVPWFLSDNSGGYTYPGEMIIRSTGAVELWTTGGDGLFTASGNFAMRDGVFTYTLN